MKTPYFHWITTATALLAALGAASTLLLAAPIAEPPAQARADAAIRPATT